MLIDAARHVLSELADVKLVLQQGDVPEMRSRLVAGDLDIIVVVGRLDPSGLDVRVAGEVRARVGMTEQLAPHGPLTVEHLRERRYLAWQGETDPMLDAIEEWALAHEFVGATTPVVPNVETLRALARAGAGYVVLPDYVMRRDESLITFEAPGLSRSLPVRVAVRKGLPESPATHVLEALVGHLES
jgi:DNA-binding transcriptional LysR family regulator